MNVNKDYQPAKYVKANKDGSVPSPVASTTKKMPKKKGVLNIVLTVLGLLLFVGGGISVFLISSKQDTTPVAPTAPQSKPAAYIEKEATCTISFDVTEPDKLACGESVCETDNDCGTDLVCVVIENTTEQTGDNGEDLSYTSTTGYCAKEEYQDACSQDPTTENCCTETNETIACGEIGCEADTDCEEGLVCLATSAIDSEGSVIKYCADESFEEACIEDPSVDSCCTEPTVTPTDEPTVTPTDEPTVTPTDEPTPEVTTVVTTVGCNDDCNANADCANISHICYEGQCRLDVNPENEQCRLPNGETVIERPVVVPTESGPENWLQYLKAGLGTLGVGALLLLLL